MNAIAREAGTSKETLYAYYPSKEALLRDALLSLFPSGSFAESGAASLVSVPDTINKLREMLVDHGVNLVRQLMLPEYLRLVRVIVAESGRMPELGELFGAAVPRPALAQTALLLEQAQSTGLIVSCDSELAARAFVGPLLTYVLLDGLLARDPRPPPRARVRALTTFFLAGLSRGGA